MLRSLDLSTLITYVVILLVSFPIHEFAHAWMADHFGDDTPRRTGRLTLNPLAHLDPIGSLLLIAFGFGWARPVPVNPVTLRRSSPAALMWVSLAGPLSNFAMAVLAAIPFRLGLDSLGDALLAPVYRLLPFLPTVSEFLWVFIYINLLLMLFNLIPIAPLDGEKVAEYFLPPAWADALERLRPFGPMILLAAVALGLLGWVIRPPLSLLMQLLIG